MQTSYMEYAMSVIISRALPDVRDGLKPVQRRILYAMHRAGATSGSRHRKCAAFVGDVLKLYHPHGDTAVYDALVRMAQPFSLRYPLIDGQGNFGSVDGDPPAAMRYTEARLSAITAELMADIEKETVTMGPNYDGSEEEPSVLPARLPNLLVNGATGIAVGMTTNIPPHNLREIVGGVKHLVDNPEATVEDLLAYVKGPDFPTGGLIMGTAGIKAAYSTGHGRIIVRARHTFEQAANGRERIIIDELPYAVNKATLVAKIADLVAERKLEGIADLRDESDRQGMRIVIELKREARVFTVLNNLYKHTTLQQTFGVIMLAIVDGRPVVLSLKQALQLFIDHRREVILRRTRFDLARAQERAHILEGLKICLDHLDEVIKTIRAAADTDSAATDLMTKFGLSDRQAKAVLALTLGRLTKLERG
ncbi:MAG TPA: DNA gyrase subunit A, partial [Patescibacteria group bacterium]|nr:DNA gyrase subunit A [Patescibacteria group bacterium]